MPCFRGVQNSWCLLAVTACVSPSKHLYTQNGSYKAPKTYPPKHSSAKKKIISSWQFLQLALPIDVAISLASARASSEAHGPQQKQGPSKRSSFRISLLSVLKAQQRAFEMKHLLTACFYMCTYLFISVSSRHTGGCSSHVSPLTSALKNSKRLQPIRVWHKNKTFCREVCIRRFLLNVPSTNGNPLKNLPWLGVTRLPIPIYKISATFQTIVWSSSICL